jgi:hypothetical protein
VYGGFPRKAGANGGTISFLRHPGHRAGMTAEQERGVEFKGRWCKAAKAGRVLVLGPAQVVGEIVGDEFDGGSGEILILSLSKDEDFPHRR